MDITRFAMKLFISLYSTIPLFYHFIPSCTIRSSFPSIFGKSYIIPFHSIFHHSYIIPFHPFLAFLPICRWFHRFLFLWPQTFHSISFHFLLRHIIYFPSCSSLNLASMAHDFLEEVRSTFQTVVSSSFQVLIYFSFFSAVNVRDFQSDDILPFVKTFRLTPFYHRCNRAHKPPTKLVILVEITNGFDFPGGAKDEGGNRWRRGQIKPLLAVSCRSAEPRYTAK